MADENLVQLTATTTPADTDLLYTVVDPAGTPLDRKITWTTIKAFLKTYFDSLYATVTNLAGKKPYHGVVARPVGASNPLPTNLTTTTFTLGATANPISYYYQGTLVNVTADKTATLDDGLGGTSAGLYFVYFNAATGNILATKTFPGILNTSNVIIAYVYWNGSNYGIVYDERHAWDRDCEWHNWAHMTIGARYGSGLTATNNGGTGAAATFQITSGNIYDEDINFTIAQATTAQTFYQTGATTYVFDSTLTARPFKPGANNRPTYVNTTGYALTEMTSVNNRYINIWVYATNSIVSPIQFFTETVTSTIAGTNGYTSVANARAIPFPNLSNLGISPEMKPIYRFICRADGVIQAIDTAQDDYRTSSSIPMSGGNVSTTASAVSFSPAGTITSTTVQTGMEELDSLKAGVGQTFYIGTTQIAINRASAALTLAGLTLTTPDLGTPSAVVLTNATGTAASLIAGKATILATARAIHGSTAFDGSAPITDIIGSVYGGTGNGFTKFTGAATAERTYTLPNQSSTIMTLNAGEIMAMTDKPTPLDADVIMIESAADTNARRKLTWANVKSFLKTYFDGIYLGLHATADNVTTNANLTGPITSVGNATTRTLLANSNLNLAEGQMSNGMIVPSTNLISNPSFETDLTRWNTYNESTNTRQTSEHYSGVASMRCVLAASINADGAGAYMQTTGILSPVVGQSYTVSFYVKGAVGGETGNVYVAFLNNITTNWTATTAWQRITISGTAISANGDIYIRGKTASSTFYVDAVQINNGSSVLPYMDYQSLTVAIKGMDGNDPSASNPVYVRINGVIRSITSALSVTKNAATNWCNAGGTELATKEIDYFTYLGFNATDGVVLGFSRISHATLYSDFSTTTTNEKYAGISTITNAAAGDNYVNIGRFAATLSAGAGYTWSVPTFTASNLIQRPIYETRNLYLNPIYTGFSSNPSVGETFLIYKIIGNSVFLEMHSVSNGTSNATTFTVLAPFAPIDVGYGKYSGTCTITDNGATLTTPGLLNMLQGSNILHIYKDCAYSNFTNSGAKNVGIGSLIYYI